MFKGSQLKEIANIIERRNMAVRDFSRLFNDDGTILTVTHKDKGFYITILLREDGYFNVEFSPNEVSLSAKSLGRLDWASIVNTVSNWAKFVYDEVNVEDPWAELGSNAFEGEDTKFTEEELEIVDRAIDASAEELLRVAATKGIEKKLDDIAEDVKVLKAEARKQTRFKWRDFFAQYMMTKLADWGISALNVSSIIDVLVHTAVPMLKIVAGSQ